MYLIEDKTVKQISNKMNLYLNRIVTLLGFVQMFVAEKIDVKKQILHDCNLTPSASRPNEPEPYFRQEALIDISFIFMKLYALDEVEEYMTYSGAFSYTITLPCIKERTLYYNKTYSIDDLWTLTDIGDYWQPAFVHSNSKNDFGLRNDVTLQIMVLPFEGMINYGISGLFTSSCELNFYKFPFDSQHCDIKIETWFLSRYLKVNSVSSTFYKGSDSFVSKNVGWKLGGIETGYEEEVSCKVNWPKRNFRGAQFHEFHASFNITRQPNFFVINVMLPCGLLTMVQGATFLLPPDSTDRPQ